MLNLPATVRDDYLVLKFTGAYQMERIKQRRLGNGVGRAKEIEAHDDIGPLPSRPD